MSHRDSARLARSLRSLTIGVTEHRIRRERELRPMEQGDMMQAVQVPVSGTAGRYPVSQEVEIGFPNAFLTRLVPALSNLPFPNPTFATGVELPGDVYVVIDTQVKDWLENDSGFLTGAKLRIAASAPGAPRLVPFTATVHLTFFGYAAPADDDSEA